MKVFKQKEDGEREILLCLITHKTVLSRLASLWKGEGLFGGVYANLVATWCVQHHRDYGEAPKRAIKGYFTEWASKTQDEEVVSAIERLLTHLSEFSKSQEEINVDHVLDMAGKLFNKVKIGRTLEAARNALDAGMLDRAEKALLEFSRVEVGLGSGVDVFTDESAMTFGEEGSEPLFEYPGALGIFFRNMLERDVLLGIQAPEKGKKSMLLLDMAYRALLKRNKVGYFSVGDMTENQVKERLYCRAAEWPTRCGDDGWPHTSRIPISISYKRSDEEKESIAKVEFKNKVFKKPLNSEMIKEACKKLMLEQVKSKKSYFRASCHPNDSISVLGIKDILDSWSAQGFHCDVICVAEGEPVLTQRGLIPIEKVDYADKVWDGMNWVAHKGVICKGVKDVITYQGFTATPDHKVWTDYGWRSLITCAQMGWRIIRSECEGKEIRVGGDYLRDDSLSLLPVSEIRKNTKGQTALCAYSLCRLCGGEMGRSYEHKERNRKRMPFVPATEKSRTRFLAENRSSKTTLPDLYTLGMEALWRARDRISFSFDHGSVFMDSKEFTGMGRSKTTVGSYRQRWSLRARKHQTINSKAELFAHLSESTNAQNAPFSATLPACQVRGYDLARFLHEEDDSRADSAALERITKTWETRRTSRVWDIVGCGPLHRFTVQGILAHNCVDYSDVLLPINTRAEPRDQSNATWKKLRAISQEMHALVVTATQASASSYEKRLQDKRDYSEDKRKLAHVNGMIGINTTAAEAEQDIFRLNWIVKRTGRNSYKRTCHVAGCLDICHPCMTSTF